MRKLKKGDKLRYSGHGNRNMMRLYHVLAVVERQIVVKSWLKHKRRWHYEILSPEYLQAFKDTLEVVR